MHLITLAGILLYIANFAFTLDVNKSNSPLYFTNEICNGYNGRRYYLELGEHGRVEATNVTVPSFVNKFSTIQNILNGTGNFKYQCRMELITCPSCAIRVTINTLNFSPTCNESDQNCKCRDFLHFSEPPYDEDIYGRQTCGQFRFYHSQTRVLVIKYVYESHTPKAFVLDYVAEKNKMESVGTTANTTKAPLTIIADVNKTMSSPFFPNFYPRDFSADYTFECDERAKNNCRLEITFTDFQIAFTSLMEIYDGSGLLLGKYNGATFRPPVIMSNGPSMVIRFSANAGSGLGYRAKVRYLTVQQANETASVFTNCGGFVESLGGAITMMKMVANTTEAKRFDCIWLIKPPNSYVHLKTHILLGVDAFENMGNWSILTLRQGLTSDRPLLESYAAPLRDAFVAKSFIAPLTVGFYVRLNGVFDSDSRLAIAYTAFSYFDCFVGPEFLCGNHRCIPFYLQCDGFDHCGDNSDETSCTINSDNENVARPWYTHTSNYFFPKTDNLADLKTATIVFLGSSIGLVFFIILLIVVLHRMGRHAREQRFLEQQIRTISGMLDASNSNINQNGDETHEEPPAYEAPPEYEEVISLSADSERCSSRGRRRSSTTNGQRRRSRSRSRCSSNSRKNSCTESLLPDLFGSSQLQPKDDIECAISSSSLSEEFLVTVNRRGSQIPLIPESPPPQYQENTSGSGQNSADLIDMSGSAGTLPISEFLCTLNTDPYIPILTHVTSGLKKKPSASKSNRRDGSPCQPNISVTSEKPRFIFSDECIHSVDHSNLSTLEVTDWVESVQSMHTIEEHPIIWPPANTTDDVLRRSSSEGFLLKGIWADNEDKCNFKRSRSGPLYFK